MIRLAAVMPIQHIPPRIIGLPPDFISFIILLFNPIAPIAMIMQNLLKSFKGAKTFEGMPIFKATVVIKDAIIKYIINTGNDFFKSKSTSSSYEVRDFIIPSTKVIGMMARVLVSFTVTALSSV